MAVLRHKLVLLCFKLAARIDRAYYLDLVLGPLPTHDRRRVS